MCDRNIGGHHGAINRDGEGKVKLLIVDDSTAVYERLLALLGGVEQMTAVAIARTLHDAREKLASYTPDAAVIDVHLPDGNGLEGIALVRAYAPSARILMFSNQLEYRALAMAAGADGFFDKSLDFERLVDLLLTQERRLPTAEGASHVC